MALPVADSPADIPANYCCDTLSKIADRIRTVALAGLCSCLDGSCADQGIRSYVAVGPRIEDPIGDSIIVHMTTFGPTTGSNDRLGHLLPVAVHRADFEVRLLETGWPTVDSDEITQQIIVPSAEMVNAVSLHLMAHGELMYRTLANSIQRQEMFVGTDNAHIGRVQISNLEPIQPSAYMAGYRCVVRVDTTL